VGIISRAGGLFYCHTIMTTGLAQHHKLKHGCYTFEFSCLKIFTTGKIKIEKAHILPLVMSMVSAKYCYVTHKLRLHQNDRCKRFTLF